MTVLPLANADEYADAGYRPGHLFGPVRRCVNHACLETYTPRTFCRVCQQPTRPLKTESPDPSRDG